MLKLEKAQINDLDYLKEMAVNVVENMHKNGINLWNKYYPAEEFEQCIKDEILYVAKKGNNIISFFVLVEGDETAENYDWKFDKEIYLQKFAINVDFLHKGYGKSVLDLIINYLKEKDYNSFRFTVYDKNLPAIGLYKKLGFNIVKGSYLMINKNRKEEPKLFIGMEYKL